MAQVDVLRLKAAGVKTQFTVLTQVAIALEARRWWSALLTEFPLEGANDDGEGAICGGVSRALAASVGGAWQSGDQEPPTRGSLAMCWTGGCAWEVAKLTQHDEVVAGMSYICSGIPVAGEHRKASFGASDQGAEGGGWSSVEAVICNACLPRFKTGGMSYRALSH